MEKNSTKSIGAAVLSKNIAFFSTSPLSLICNIDTTYDAIKSFSWSCDNKSFCFGGDKNYLTFSQSNVPKSHKQFGQNSQQNYVRFSKTKPDIFISGGKSDVSMIWQIKGADLIPIRGYKNNSCQAVTSACFNLDDTLMAMGCVGYNASFLNIYETEENKAPVRSYSLNSKETTVAIEFSPYSKNNFAVTTSCGAFYFFDVNFNDPVITIANESASARGVFFSPLNRNGVIISYADNRINIYDMLHRKTIESIVTQQPIVSFCALEDGNNFLVGTVQGKIYQYDSRNKKHPIDFIELGGSDVTLLSTQRGVAFTPDTTTIAHVYEMSGGKIDESLSSSKYKRRSKDPLHATPSFKDNLTHNIKNFKNMFASPAMKKSRVTIGENNAQYDCVQDSMSQSIESVSNKSMTGQSGSFKTESHKSYSLWENTLPSAKTSISYVTEPDVDTAPKNEIDDNEFQYFYLNNLKYLVHSEIRDLQIELVRQQYHQTNEIKNYVCEVIEETQSRERELMEENQRLRDEIIYLQNTIKMNQPPTKN